MQSWDLELIADVTAGYKKLTICLVVSPHVPTLKHEANQQLITQKRLFQLKQTNKQTAVSRSYAIV